MNWLSFRIAVRDHGFFAKTYEDLLKQDDPGAWALLLDRWLLVIGLFKPHSLIPRDDEIEVAYLRKTRQFAAVLYRASKWLGVQLLCTPNDIYFELGHRWYQVPAPPDRLPLVVPTGRVAKVALGDVEWSCRGRVFRAAFTELVHVQRSSSE
jgi:hypothetical protein